MHALLIIAPYILLCVLIAYLGKNRKWGFWGYLWPTLLLTPLIGLLLVFASDKRKPQQYLKKR